MFKTLFKKAKSSNSTGKKLDPSELFDLLKSYAKQELLDPLKSLPRWLGLGLLGSFGLIVGIVLLLMAMLRALQTETGTMFTGNLSWAPYVAAIGALLIIALLLISRISSSKAK